MSDDVIPFKPQIVGNGVEFNASDMLDGAKAHDLGCVVIIGDDPQGELYVACSGDTGTALVQLHRAINYLVENTR